MGATGTHSDGVPIIAFCVRRAAGQVLAERLADEQFYAASTVKLAVLIAVARALEAGTVTLETALTSADTFRSEAPGAPDFRIDPGDVDEGMRAPGTPMPLADVVERMVVVSSNEATNMVVELLGRDVVNAALADAGADVECVRAQVLRSRRRGARRQPPHHRRRSRGAHVGRRDGRPCRAAVGPRG